MSETIPQNLAQDLSLQWPQDCDAAQIDALLQTLGVQAIELSERIQRVHDGSGGLSDLDAAQQICEVLQDSTTTVPIPGIVNMVLALDAALQNLLERQTLPNASQAALLLAACDCLEQMYDALQGLGAPPGLAPNQAADVLQSLRDWVHDEPTTGEDSTGDAAHDRLLDLAGQHSILAARLSRLLDHYQVQSRHWQASLLGLNPEADQHFQNLDALFESLYKLQQRYQQLNQATEQAIYGLTAQPLAHLEPVLQAALQAGNHQFGKQAELLIRGGDTLIDAGLWNALTTPLIQLLNNALEHGIEAETERLAANKPAIGRVVLHASQHGSTLRLRCEDDGRGLQLDAIRVAAELGGIIAPDQPLTEQQLTELVLTSGLSTRPRSEDPPPGLSQVRAQIKALGGWLHIDHRVAQGCAVEFRLPLRRVTAKLLLVPSGEAMYGIHERGLLNVIPPGEGRIHRDHGALRYRLQGETYPAQLLETLLAITPTATAAEERTALLFNGNDDQQHIVLVETPEDTSPRVVQPVGRFVPQSPGLIGVSQLSTEPFIPVVDLAGLLGQTAIAAPVAELPSGTRVLLVDDSRSVLRSLGQVLEGADLSVRTASDGQEALELVGRAKPDIALIDLEMPRMDGLELIRRLRAQTQTQALPIIVITARGTPEQIREAEALGIHAYLTKPVSHTELLQQVQQALNSA